MMAKPIRALELHYPMIQFLVIAIIPEFQRWGRREEVHSGKS